MADEATQPQSQQLSVSVGEEVTAGTADPLLLPEEILSQVLGYLTPSELGRLCLVSKNWKRAAEEDTVWLDMLSEVPDAERSPGLLTRPPSVPAKWFFLVKTRALVPRSNKAHLIGYLVTDNSIYEGELTHGHWNGYGAITWPDGEYYQGEFHKGTIHGRGFKRYASGHQFDGEWVRNQRKEGAMLFKNGNMYDGPFVDGKFHGKGVFRWRNGDQFEGDFAEGRMVRGTLTLLGGQKHTGVVKDVPETTFDDPSSSPPYPASEEPTAAATTTDAASA